MERGSLSFVRTENSINLATSRNYSYVVRRQIFYLASSIWVFGSDAVEVSIRNTPKFSITLLTTVDRFDPARLETQIQ